MAQMVDKHLKMLSHTCHLVDYKPANYESGVTLGLNKAPGIRIEHIMQSTANTSVYQSCSLAIYAVQYSPSHLV